MRKREAGVVQEALISPVITQASTAAAKPKAIGSQRADRVKRPRRKKTAIEASGSGGEPLWPARVSTIAQTSTSAPRASRRFRERLSAAALSGLSIRFLR